MNEIVSCKAANLLRASVVANEIITKTFVWKRRRAKDQASYCLLHNMLYKDRIVLSCNCSAQGFVMRSVHTAAGVSSNVTCQPQSIARNCWDAMVGDAKSQAAAGTRLSLLSPTGYQINCNNRPLNPKIPRSLRVNGHSFPSSIINSASLPNSQVTTPSSSQTFLAATLVWKSGRRSRRRIRS